MTLRNVPGDSFTFSTLLKSINQFNADKYLDKGIKLVKEATSHPAFKADEILFNVLIDACIKCKSLSKAIEVFN